MQVSSDEVAALKARLRERQAQRQFDADADEAIRLVRRRGPGGPLSQAVRPDSSPSGGAKGERTTALEAREYVARVIPAERAFSAAAVAVILARSVIDNWLFLLVLGFVVFGAAAVI